MDFKCPICRTVIPQDKLYAGVSCPFCGAKMDQSYIDNHMTRAKQEEEEKRKLNEPKKEPRPTIAFKLIGKDFPEDKFKSVIFDVIPCSGRHRPDTSKGPGYPSGDYIIRLGLREISPHHVDPIVTANTSSQKIRITDRTAAVTVYYKKGLFSYKIDHIEVKED